MFKGRNLRSSMNLDTTEITIFRGNDTRPCDGLVVGHLGSRMFHIMDRADGSTHRRHLDQISVSVPSNVRKQPDEPPHVENQDVQNVLQQLEYPIATITPSQEEIAADTSHRQGTNNSTSPAPLRRSTRTKKVPVKLLD